jgi:hypothetical protein
MWKHSSPASLTRLIIHVVALGLVQVASLFVGVTGLGQTQQNASNEGVPSVVLRKAELVQFPGVVDCNSPGHWEGGTFYVFNSAPDPFRSSGSDLSHLGTATVTTYHNKANGGRWIEATHKDADTLYGWYHNEPHPVCEANPKLTAPRIGAVSSQDNGANWKDLGFILEAPPDSLFCGTENKYFAGGNGDFSVILDNKGGYFYFFISTYHKNTAEQGVAIARMSYSDRKSPTGKVWKWYHGNWNEPGLGGHVSPIFPVSRDWNRRDADAFWGPSVHWNSYVNSYVILLNRAIDGDWKQEGIYVTFSHDLSDPASWTSPQRILERGEIIRVPEMKAGWYPQVVGTDTSQHETDKLAGRVSRLFVHGKSVWEIAFAKPGEELK